MGKIMRNNGQLGERAARQSGMQSRLPETNQRAARARRMAASRAGCAAVSRAGSGRADKSSPHNREAGPSRYRLGCANQRRTREHSEAAATDSEAAARDSDEAARNS